MNPEHQQFSLGKAAIFNGTGKPFEFITGTPVLKSEEILVRNLYTTLCGSDIHTYFGRRTEPAQVVLGHEIVGDIVWIADDHAGTDYNGNTIKTGDRVVWSIFCVPENIEAPRADLPQKSEQLFKYGHALANGNDIFNGGLASYCVLRANTAFVKISAGMPLKVAATISCAHATVTGALRVAGYIEGKRVLIFGAGLLGLSCVAMCREANALWVGLLDNDSSRVQWGKSFGTDENYIIKDDDNKMPWPEADIVFDMTGSPAAMKTGLDSLALGGIAVWIGAVFPADAVQVDAQQIVRKVLQIRGLHNYNYDDFINAAAFIEKNYKKYPFNDLVEKEYELDEIEEAFKYASVVKPVRVGIKIN